MQKLGSFREGSFQPAMLRDQKQFLCDSATGLERTWWTHWDGMQLICTDVPPHIHKRVTTVTSSPSPGARLRILLLGPSTLHTTLFDFDRS